MIKMKTIKAHFTIFQNNEKIQEIPTKLTIEDTWKGDNVRKFIRDAANLKKDDEFRIVNLTDPEQSIVSASYFLTLDPIISDYRFRIDIKDDSKC